jgi:hypothetical protein
VREPQGQQPPSGLPLVLFVFAAIDLILALALLVVDGFSWQFWAIALIGVAFAAYALKERVFPTQPK